MATAVITVKLTPAEVDVLDWLVQTGCYLSRSEALRRSMILRASQCGLRNAELEQLDDERDRHPPRKRVIHIDQSIRPARRPGRKR